MALRGVKPQAVQKRLKALFYGLPSSGKTTAAINFPAPYLIDTERGCENDSYIEILNKNGGVVFNTSDFDEMYLEVKSLLTEKHEFKTLVIDPLTHLYDDLLEKSAAHLKSQSKDKEATGTEFGRHYSEAAKKMKQLMSLLTRLDMNVIITSHAKKEYEMNGKEMKVTGVTFDCYKKLDYLFDLVFEVRKQGKQRSGVVIKTRIDSFPDGEVAKRYGRDILEKDSINEILATHEQCIQLDSLIDLLKIPEDMTTKWLDKANVIGFADMNTETIQKCIDHLTSKLPK